MGRPQRRSPHTQYSHGNRTVERGTEEIIKPITIHVSKKETVALLAVAQWIEC